MGKQEEMIKALIVGQNTNIESKFIDDKVWDVSLPCIILTNKITTFHYFCTSPEYKNETIKIAINEYFEPKGTEPEIKIKNCFLDTITEMEFKKIEEKKKNSNYKNYNKIFK